MTAAILMDLAKRLHSFASWLKHGVTPNIIIVVGSVVRRGGEKVEITEDFQFKASALLGGTLDQFIKAELGDEVAACLRCGGRGWVLADNPPTVDCPDCRDA